MPPSYSANMPQKIKLTLTRKAQATPQEQITRLLTEISESLKRARRKQAEINRLKKKTQAILDKLEASTSRD
jgi:Tfp pilus assembly protein PilN